MADITDLIARLRGCEWRVAYSHVDRLRFEAADALTAQARELEALRADAERLDWMSTHEARIGWNREGDMCQVWVRSDDPFDPSWELVCGYGKVFNTHREAIDAAMQASEPTEGGKAVTPDADKCRKCGGRMVEGTYLAQTFSGTPDFPGDRHAVTVSPSGPGRLAECLKCEACGWSVTGWKAVTP